MEHLLQGLPGAKTVIDNMLVYGNEDNHESRFRAVLDRIRLSVLKLNKDKCHPKLDTLVMYSAMMGYVQILAKWMPSRTWNPTECSRVSLNPGHDKVPRKVSAWVVQQHSALTEPCRKNPF